MPAMPFKKLSEDQIKAFHRDGYIVIKNFCSRQEIDKLYTTAIEDSSISQKTPWT